MLGTVNPFELLGGFALSLVIGLLGYKRGALSGSGVAGALITGTLMFGLGGWEWGTCLIVFFVSSSAFSFYRAREKQALAEKFAKGHRRDLGQALANGGLAALLAVLSQIFPSYLSRLFSPGQVSQLFPPYQGGYGGVWFLACAGAMAAVNADTWATELGVLSPSLPRLITTWKPVERGTSGAISLYGTLAAIGGAAFIGLLGALLGSADHGFASLEIIIMAGLLGSLFDSFLGATVQAIYRCPQCDKETEKHPLHTCGTQTVQVRGWHSLNNDMVNLGCALVGAIIGMIL
jgi:uncharacterized membrane protein